MPRLGRIDVVFNSFGGCISDAAEKFSWTPKMSFSEIISQPRMLSQKFKGRISFKQLKCFAHTHCWRQLNKQVDMVNSDVKFVDFTSMFDSNFMDESFTVTSNSEKFKWIHSIFTFPDKMESILPEGMCKTLQIHFLSPAQQRARELMLSEFIYFIEGNVSPLSFKEFQELNLLEEGNSSLCLKAEVSLPFM